MDKKNSTTNILLCGVGGQGVILASTVISNALVKAGFDVKKSEVHGMSQRGGAVTSHVRFGQAVYSPLIPRGEANYLFSLNPVETIRNKHDLKDNGVILECPQNLKKLLPDLRCENVCLTGIFSQYLDIDEKIWLDVLSEKIAPKILNINIEAFQAGRNYKIEGI